MIKKYDQDKHNIIDDEKLEKKKVNNYYLIKLN